MGGYAWVTLATNDSYSLGALVLAHSLRGVGTKHDLAVLVTPGVTATMREKLSTVFTLVQEVNVLDSKDEANLALLARPELGITFTKLHCWRLTQYEKCVFVDADALVIRNCDELFDRDEFSAAPDVGWPDCFNSGVFVFRPSDETFASLTSFAAAKGSFDGGDQGLLNQYFSDWARSDIAKHLPFIYNMCSTATYSYLPAFKQYGDDVRIIHFIGSTKPWLQYFDTITSQVHPAPGTNHLQPLLQLWWNIFCDKVHPELSPVMASSTLAQDWHEYKYEPPSIFHDPVTIPLSKSSDYLLPYESDATDFSEFHDPWENYRETTDLTSTTSNVPMTIDNHYDDHLNNNNNRGHTDMCNRREDSKIPPVLENIVHHVIQDDGTHSSLGSTDFHNHHHVPQNNQIQNTPAAIFEPRSEQHIVENNCDIANEQFLKTHETHGSEQRHPIFYREANERFEEKMGLVETVEYDGSRNYEARLTDECAFDVSVVRTDSPNHASLAPSTPCTESNGAAFTPPTPCTESNDAALAPPTPCTESNSASLPPPPSSPCTKSNSVTVRSETMVTGQLESNDAGIAGALAKITLGVARSPEQVAFEEHMRKRSWEEGQIDYMGRDSFENIWKKISETLGKQLERQPSPPKVAPKSEEMETEKSLPRPIEVGPEAETVAAALSGLECKVEKEDPLIDELAHGDDMRKLILPLSELMQVETGEPTTMVAATTMAPLEESKMAVDKIEEVLVGRKDVPEVENMEIPTESQVPIQVAESVLEADVKESVTEDLKPVTEEAISSIALAAQESVPAVLETAMEAVDSMVPRSNGRADKTSEIGNGIDALEIASSAGLASATVAVVEGISLPVEPRLAVTEEEPKSPQTPPELPTETAQSVPLVPTATSLNQTQKDNENPVAAPPAVDPPPKAEKPDSTPCCVNAGQSVPTTEPVTQGELLSCPLKPTKKMEDLPVKMEEDMTPRDSQISVSSAGTEVPETTLGKEVPEVSADTVAFGKSVDKKLSKESVDKKTSEDSIGKEDPKESIGEVNPEVPVVKKDLAVLIGKENLKESTPKVVSKDSVETEVAEKSGVKEVAKKSVGKEVAKKSVDKVVVKKPVDKDAPKKPVDKKVPKQSTDKEGPKDPVNKEVCATSIDKEVPRRPVDKDVPEKPVDREGSGESSEASLSIEDSSPLRPARTKELQIPDTPTVTEATPPTSPPIGGAAASLDDPQATNRTTKKTVKKVVKKTSETKSTPEATVDPDTEVKKVTKKIVKKSTKKKEEDANVPTEAKKVIKTVKKTTTKTQQQTLDVTEAAAPETPPPSAPEVPVPPKRKLKTTTKTTSQKTDSET